ncbi:hypothetical protein MRX96_027704 [Rhipicephalus microplus]
MMKRRGSSLRFVASPPLVLRSRSPSAAYSVAPSIELGIETRCRPNALAPGASVEKAPGASVEKAPGACSRCS